MIRGRDDAAAEVPFAVLLVLEHRTGIVDFRIPIFGSVLLLDDGPREKEVVALFLFRVQRLLRVVLTFRRTCGCTCRCREFLHFDLASSVNHRQWFTHAHSATKISLVVNISHVPARTLDDFRIGDGHNGTVVLRAQTKGFRWRIEHRHGRPDLVAGEGQQFRACRRTILPFHPSSRIGGRQRRLVVDLNDCPCLDAGCGETFERRALVSYCLVVANLLNNVVLVGEQDLAVILAHLRFRCERFHVREFAHLGGQTLLLSRDGPRCGSRISSSI